MTDFIDRVAERSAELLGDALLEQERRAGLSGKTIDDSAHTCAECGEAIDERRRAAVPGVQLCVFCKQFAEERQAHGRA